MTKLDEQFEAVIDALEAGDFDAARTARKAAHDGGTPSDHVALRFLDFLLEWLDGAELDDEQVMANLHRAEALLPEAASHESATIATRVVLDLAEILASLGVIDEAEHALRTLAARSDLDPEASIDVLTLRVEIVLDHHEDPELALELLDGVGEAFASTPSYLSLRAGALTDLGRADEALALLRAAVEANGDVELRYQLGMMLRAAGELDDAAAQLKLVREHDISTHEIELEAEIPRPEIDDLRRQLEEVIESLPDPVLKRVGSAPIRVERWPSEARVASGGDPRSPVHFEGRAELEHGEAQLDAIVIHRDTILRQIIDDEEILDLLTLGLVEEFDRLFDIELIPG